MFNLKKSRHNWSLHHKILRVLWNITWYTFGYYGPRLFSPLRINLLRLFGAKIGVGSLVCSHVKVLMPWNLIIDDFVSIGDGVNLYNFANITIGRNTCISQRVWLCTGTHEYKSSTFPLIWRPIQIGSSVWIAAEVFVHPNVTIEDFVIVAARSVVYKNLLTGSIYGGNPAVFIKDRPPIDIK